MDPEFGMLGNGRRGLGAFLIATLLLGCGGSVKRDDARRPAAGDAGLAGAGTSGSPAGALAGDAGSSGEAGGTGSGGSAGQPYAGAPSHTRGAGGSANPTELLLDPSTLTFYLLDTAWIQPAVSGYDPAARACVTLVWRSDDGRVPMGATCHGPSEVLPRVVVRLEQDAPCELELMPEDYLETTSAVGCFDDASLSGSGIDLLDMAVEVKGAAFTGKIVADNRSPRVPAPITFGLRYTTDVPETVYVQSTGLNAHPDWIHVSRHGEALQLFDSCLRDCDQAEPLDCTFSLLNATAIVDNGYRGATYLTWDGSIRETSEDGSCENRVPAPAGDYQVEVCFGYEFHPLQNGDAVANPQCITQDFALPNDEVIVAADFGG